MGARTGPSCRLVLGGAVLLLAVVLGIGIGRIVGRSSPPTISSSSPVQPADLNIPKRIASIPLVNQSGQTTDLSALHGRVIVLADFMTSCQEECPITAGALLSVDQALKSAHLLDKVEIVEVSVDPWRDDPSRMRAYSKAFGVFWTLLSGSQADLSQLWSWFGVFYQRVKEGNPPDINWETAKPYTFDIVHSDDVFILGSSGTERALVQGNANVDGRLPKDLASLLSSEGRKDLTDPGLGSWTPKELLQAIAAVLGQTIPASSS